MSGCGNENYKIIKLPFCKSQRSGKCHETSFSSSSYRTENSVRYGSDLSSNIASTLPGNHWGGWPGSQHWWRILLLTRAAGFFSNSSTDFFAWSALLPWRALSSLPTRLLFKCLHLWSTSSTSLYTRLDVDGGASFILLMSKTSQRLHLGRGISKATPFEVSWKRTRLPFEPRTSWWNFSWLKRAFRWLLSGSWDSLT